MITKAIIEEVITPYSARVRIPIYNKSKDAPLHTPTSELAIARVCALPNFHVNMRKGDIVYVGFEDNDQGKPLIIGYLQNELEQKSFCDITVNSLTAKVSLSAPKDTTIGQVSKESISYLQNLSSNLRGQLDIIDSKLKALLNQPDTPPSEVT